MPAHHSPLRPRFGGVLFNGAPPRARKLTFAAVADGEMAGIRFDLDRCFSGDLLVDWSAVGGLPAGGERAAVNLALAALVAQHALPRGVSGPMVDSPQAARSFRQLLGLLYDVRASCDETPLRRAPVVDATDCESVPAATGAAPDGRRVLVLLSGGFDSTFAALLLRRAGYQVHALHVRCNRHVEEVEERAARAVAAYLDIPLHVVRLVAPDQEGLGRRYSRTFGQFPFYNSIPHGRDLPLAVIAGIVAERLGCGAIAFGHEKESRRKVLAYRGRRIYRHDVESAHGTALAAAFLRGALGARQRLFSPVAGASIYRVRSAVMRHAPRLGALVQSCLWSRRCEKCLKCLSTYTMQRHLGVEYARFEQNPFADPDDRDMALLAEPDRPSEALAYGPQMHYAMVSLLRSGQATTEDHWLHRFRESGLPQVEAEWDAIARLCLTLEPTAEVPADVHAVAEGMR